jgi:hypothetical protein
MSKLVSQSDDGTIRARGGGVGAGTFLDQAYDYLLFPNDGLRHEIIGGEHYVTPSPAMRHQRIADSTCSCRTSTSSCGSGD